MPAEQALSCHAAHARAAGVLSRLCKFDYTQLCSCYYYGIKTGKTAPGGRPRDNSVFIDIDGLPNAGSFYYLSSKRPLRPRADIRH